MNRVAFHNLGCKVNSYELDIMRQKMEEHGYVSVPFEEEADVYVINTCTVTNIADRKSRQMIRRARRRNPDALICAVGCYVQTASVRGELPEEADLLIGSGKKEELVARIDQFLREKNANGTRAKEQSQREQLSVIGDVLVKMSRTPVLITIQVEDGAVPRLCCVARLMRIIVSKLSPGTDAESSPPRNVLSRERVYCVPLDMGKNRPEPVSSQSRMRCDPTAP